MGTQNVNFGPKLLPKMEIFRPKICIFGWKFSDKKNTFWYLKFRRGLQHK